MDTVPCIIGCLLKSTHCCIMGVWAVGNLYCPEAPPAAPTPEAGEACCDSSPQDELTWRRLMFAQQCHAATTLLGGDRGLRRHIEHGTRLARRKGLASTSALSTFMLHTTTQLHCCPCGRELKMPSLRRNTKRSPRPPGSLPMLHSRGMPRPSSANLAPPWCTL